MTFFEPWESTVEKWITDFMPVQNNILNKRYVEVATQILQVSSINTSNEVNVTLIENTHFAQKSSSTVNDINNNNIKGGINYESFNTASLSTIQYSGEHSVRGERSTARPHEDDSDVERAVARELFLTKPPPPKGYVCDLCHQEGHYKNMCPKILSKASGFTPYQGMKQCFGEFICNRCKRKWTSYQSWANFAQKCVKCKINVFPKKQRPLMSSCDVMNKHPQHLCQRCKTYGYNCSISIDCKIIKQSH